MRASSLRLGTSTMLVLLVGCVTPPAAPVAPIEPPATEPALQDMTESWTLQPTSIQHLDNTLFVQAALAYTPTQADGKEQLRDHPVFVGVTAVTSTGEEIDLAVTTFFPGNFQAPFTLSAEVGPDVHDVLFGVWDRKIEPCDSNRSGCKEFGFLLDGSLATWPPTVYTDGTRQRIPSGDLNLLVLDGGVGDGLPDRVNAANSGLIKHLKIFGSTPTATQVRAAEGTIDADGIEVLDDHDVLLGRQLAKTLGVAEDNVVHNKDAPAAFVLSLSGDHPEAVRACKQLEDAAYLRCLGER